MNLPRLRIGTRGSPLALAQTRVARALLAAAHGVPEERFAIETIRTTGDAIQDRPLADAGGKGLFTKELDLALIEGRIDLAVHSAKDLPAHLPPEIAVAGYLAREDVRDAWIGREGLTIEKLPQGARVGTASVRRAAQLKRLRPDLSIALLRGNVETRLRKVESGELDGTLLALAGLKRLGLEAHATAVLSLEDFVPAPGQGAIAIAARAGDAGVSEALAPILDGATGAMLATERAFLAVLDGSCRTPIAAHAWIEDGEVVFRGLVLRTDGAEAFEARRRGPVGDGALLGDSAAQEILLRLPHGLAGL